MYFGIARSKAALVKWKLDITRDALMAISKLLLSKIYHFNLGGISPDGIV
jgi:hypothetical protein